MNTIEKVLEIIQKTNDGNELAPHHLKLTENAVNGFLNEKGLKALDELYNQVQNGYKKPWFQGVEHITIDNEWYVYWKGVQVEHYTLSAMLPEKQKKEAEELSLMCQWMEKNDIEVNSFNYMKHVTSKEARFFVKVSMLKKGETAEVSEELYKQSLDNAPPIFKDKPGFVAGEPYSHNQKGEPVYYCFYKMNSKYYGFLGTENEYKSKPWLQKK